MGRSCTKAPKRRPPPDREGNDSFGTTVVIDLSVLVLAGFVGYSVISKVPNTLHTPLMSGTNAIHGIVVLGGLLLMHEAHGLLEHAVLVIAIAFGTINIVGGFVGTDRILGMFKRKPALPEGPAPDELEGGA